MENNSDEKLIRQYLKGDKESLEILVKKYLKPVYSFVRYLVGDDISAEDITQEVFVRAWKNLKKFDIKKNFKTWIFSIAKNAAVDYLRKKKAVPFSAFDNDDGGNMIAETLTDPAPLPSETTEQADTAHLLRAAMKNLSENHQTVLYLKYYSCLTFKKISELTGVPLHTAKSRHRRALAALRDALTEIL
ncbi:MAG: sigma-70 family RNA polymerase sigma factor [Patescibacteria group bacterium]